MTRSGSVPSSAPLSADEGRDRAWIAAIRAGDQRAFEALFRAYVDDLVDFVASIVRSTGVAEELIQDLFFRIWQQRELWELSGPVRTYLFRAARNRAISHMRHERMTSVFLEQVARGDAARPHGTTPPPDETVREFDVTRAVERAVDDMPDRCREVFRLSRYHHLSNAEVAAVLGISPNTVEVQISRAIAFLRKRLAAFR